MTVPDVTVPTTLFKLSRTVKVTVPPFTAALLVVLLTVAFRVTLAVPYVAPAAIGVTDVLS